MVIVNFNNNDIYATAYGAWQWDYGQFLRIQGLKLPSIVEIHFSLQETGGTSETRLGTTKNGVTDVPIPDDVLEVDTKNNYTAFAYIYITDSTSGQTEYKIRLPIKARPKPEYMPNTPDGDLFRETIEMVNESADRASASATLAESYAVGGTGTRDGEDTDNAKYYAMQSSQSANASHMDMESTNQMMQSVVGMKNDVSEDKSTVSGYVERAESAKTDAISAQSKAEEAQSGVESAKTDAQEARDEALEAQASAETARDEAREAKTQAQQANANVQELKTAIDTIHADVQNAKTKAETAQSSAESAKNDAQQAKEDAELAQAKAEEAQKGAEEAQSSAETAKTDAQEARDEALEAQNSAETALSSTQQILNDVTVFKNEIVADREQINQNKNDIATLFNSVAIDASGIICESDGTQIVVNDSADKKIPEINIFGKTTQVTTTGAQLLDASSMLYTDTFRSYFTITFNDDGSVNINGTNNTENPMVYSSRLLDLSPGEYTFSSYCNGVKQTVVYIKITKSDGSKVYLANIYNRTFSIDGSELSITIYFQFSSGDTINDTYRFMLNAGSTALPWEPYTGGKPSPSIEYPQEFTSVGDKGNIGIKNTTKNLADLSKIVPSSATPKVVCKYDRLTGTLEIVGTPTIYDYFVLPSSYLFVVGETYTVSFDAIVSGLPSSSDSGVNVAICFGVTSNKTYKRYRENGTYKIVMTITYKQNDHFIFFMNYGSSYPINTVFTNIQIELGNTATSFEPYKSSSATIPLIEPLRALPVTSGGNYTDENGQQWMSDVLTIRSDGSGKIKREYANKVFDGTESLYINTSSGKTYIYYIPSSVASTYGLSTHMSVLTNPYISCFTKNDCVINGYIYFNPIQTDIAYDNVDDFKAFLAAQYATNTPVTVLYKLATPIIEELTSEQVQGFLQTYKPNTIITNDENAYMEVSYVADTKTYIDNKFTELATALIGG